MHPPLRIRRGPLPLEATAALAIAAFVAFFALHAFRWPWVGDVHLYLAAVAEKMRDPATLRHEAALAPAAASHVYSPYISAVAWIGRALDTDPYRALQIAAVANLALYAAAMIAFARRWSAWSRGSLVPAAMLLYVTAFLRDRAYAWSSDTSFVGLRLISAYPSMLAWSLALLAFAVVDRKRAAPMLFALLALLFQIHLITGAWVAGIVLLRARRRLDVVLAVAIAVLVCKSGIEHSLAFTAIAEGPPFAGRALSTFTRLLIIATPAALYFASRGRHRFTLVAMFATLAGLLVFRATEISFGERFGLFYGLFPAIIVADAAALGLARAIERKQLSALAPFVVVLLACAIAPPLRDRARRGEGLTTVFDRPSTIMAYWTRTDAYARILEPTDVVIMPSGDQALELAAATGARVVFSPFAYRIEDAQEREAELARFFEAGTDEAVRRATIAKWGATYVLAPAAIAPSLAWLGPPALVTPESTLFEAR